MRRTRKAFLTTRKHIRPRWARIETDGEHVSVSCTKCNFVDQERVQRLHALLLGVMSRDVRSVELDLREVEGVDTKLLAALVAAARSARECGVPLRILASAELHRVIALCRLDSVLCESLAREES